MYDIYNEYKIHVHKIALSQFVIYKSMGLVNSEWDAIAENHELHRTSFSGLLDFDSILALYRAQ